MTLVDTVTWLSLVSLRDPAILCVSTNLSHEFVRPAGREGDVLYAEGETVKAGRRVAFARITFTDAGGRVTGFGAHTLALMPDAGASTGASTSTFTPDGEARVDEHARGKL
ncbi:hypothetical protein VHUM_03978 [Vanrija humicola]|uniref:Thioesterase domain-containing protein n=1 Tax=Vanrija humicola TaxID=5417 RepID=A0A7D8UWE9_VANHU|nr:hypothetical protein VHUM_03978 [Vanrija humicola]